MSTKYSAKADLLIEEAVRMESIGRKGTWFQGKIRSSAELRKLAGEPVFPLPPFNAYEYHRMYKQDGSSSSGGY